MPAFLFALVAVALTSFGSRDQLLVAALSERLGKNIGLLLTGCMIAVGSALAMAWGGHYVAALLPGAGKTMLVALALLVAAVGLAWPNISVSLREPTHSLGAIAIVLLARQIGDGSRFLVFAFAAATGTPWFAAAGGALGGIVAVALGWFLAGKLQSRVPLRALRLVLAAIVGGAAIVIGLSARGLID